MMDRQQVSETMNRERGSRPPRNVVTTLSRGNVLRMDKIRIHVDSEYISVFAVIIL
jgi:hypothetical protein